MSQPDVAAPIATTAPTPLTRLSALEKRQLAARVKAVVGVDAGKFTHVLVIRPSGAADSRPVSCPVTPEGFAAADEAIRRAAPGASPSDILVGIEFAGAYGFTLAHYLHARGFLVTSVLAAHTKRWKEVTHRQAIKTDAKDAAAICDLVAQGKFVGFASLAKPYAELRYLVSAREHVATLRNAAITRLTAVLDLAWPEFPTYFADLGFETPVALLTRWPLPEDLVAASARSVGAVAKRSSRNHVTAARVRAIRASARTSIALDTGTSARRAEMQRLLERWRLVRAQIAAVEARLGELVAASPAARALTTVPGISIVCAATLVAEVGDPHGYASPRQVLKLAGMNLVRRQSGTSVLGRVRQTKRGRPLLRRQLFLLAGRWCQPTGLYRAQYERMLRQGKSRTNAVCAIARKLVPLVLRVMQTAAPFDHARWTADRRTPTAA